jgi:hypothetical protein
MFELIMPGLSLIHNNKFSSLIKGEKTISYGEILIYLGPFGSCSPQLCHLFSWIFMITKEEFQTLLGHNVRRIRRDKNYTVEDLGFESGLGYSQVSRIELGKRNPTAYTLLILSKALNVCPSEFFKPQSRDNSLP